MHFVNVYCIFFCVVSHVTAENETSFEGTQLWHATMRNVADIVFIKQLIDNQDVDLWYLSSMQADFLVRPENAEKVGHMLQINNLTYNLVMANIQRSVDEQKQAPILWNEHTLRLGYRLSWSSYPSLHIIEEYYNFLAEDYTSLCKVQTIGHTSENRTIKMINITNGNPNNQIIVIIGGIHGREWVSITSALYVVNTIITDFDQQPEHIKSVNWLIIPVANPDGYKYSFSTDRLWRKNRRQFFTCKGADINRNFDIDWDIAGITETDECRPSYAGTFSFSEAESVAFRDLIWNLTKTATALIDIHSYGNTILYPWSARAEKTDDFDMHAFTAEGMVKAIHETTGTLYSHGSTYHKLYPATGSLLDWAYSQGITHTYVIETRDNGHYGFLLPAREIEGCGKDVYSAIEFLAKTIEPQIMRTGKELQTWF